MTRPGGPFNTMTRRVGPFTITIEGPVRSAFARRRTTSGIERTWEAWRPGTWHIKLVFWRGG